MIAEAQHEWLTPPQIDKLLTQMMLDAPLPKYRSLIQTFYPLANIHFRELRRETEFQISFPGCRRGNESSQALKRILPFKLKHFKNEVNASYSLRWERRKGRCIPPVWLISVSALIVFSRFIFLDHQILPHYVQRYRKVPIDGGMHGTATAPHLVFQKKINGQKSGVQSVEGRKIILCFQLSVAPQKVT